MIKKPPKNSYGILQNNKYTILLIAFLMLTTFCFAQEAGVKNLLSHVLGFFTSGYMKAILTIALGGSFIGMIGNRGEQGIWKKFLPVLIVSAGLLSLTVIVDMVFNVGTEIEAKSWSNIDL